MGLGVHTRRHVRVRIRAHMAVAVAVPVAAALGISYVMLYASAPYPTSEEQRMEFAHLKQEANSIPGYDDALHGLQMASEDV